jgi:hypothetical protein
VSGQHAVKPRALFALVLFAGLIALVAWLAVHVSSSADGRSQPSAAADELQRRTTAVPAHLDVAVHMFDTDWCLHLQTDRPFARADSCEDKSR